MCRPAGRIAQAPWRTSLYPAWFSGALFLRFLRIGFTVCGGPVVPVVMARCELMGKARGISSDRLNRLLAFTQALVGPEAHELSTMRRRAVIGEFSRDARVPLNRCAEARLDRDSLCPAFPW